MMLTREMIVAEARTMLGAPFRHQGNDPATGLDCRGLLVALARRFGHEPAPHPIHYKRRPKAAELLAYLRAEPLIEEIEVAELRASDIALLCHEGEQEATHVGLIADGPYEVMLIHAYGTLGKGSVIEEPYRAWRERTRHAFQFTEVA